ncbi:MAG: VC_2705 family sodium/solute symporter, partial [Cyclobacteriaceae bacterium]|nr:VC_2705 family sodium/solute symporter [Cyclobacteriaceae bacterium]
GYALLFIAILYTTAPAVAAFARTNLIETVNNKSYSSLPDWFSNWEKTGLLSWIDKNEDGKIQYRAGNAMEGTPALVFNEKDEIIRGKNGEATVSNKPSEGENELYIDRDIMVLANPEIAQLPNWVVALVAAGGLAAALSTAAGLLLVISTSVAHDLLKKQFVKNLNDKGELVVARISAAVAVIVAGLFGIYPPGFVAQVVAFAFGLAASSFFPAIILGIFTKRMNKQGAIAGMVSGLLFTAIYIVYFKFINPAANTADHWWFGISPEGIGTLGMIINFVVSLTVMSFTPAPPEEIQEMVEDIRRA